MAWIVETEGDVAPLEPWLARIEDCVYRVEEMVETRIGRFPVDVVLRSTRQGIIVERGHGGACFKPGRMDLFFDPDNENFCGHLGEPLERMVVHEAHHAARWRGPGYGQTLGAAIVTEGLACRFVEEVFGGPPEPWECALDETRLRRWCARALSEAMSPMYDHRLWFFGTGVVPRWTGYAVGFDLVGRFLAQAEDGRASAHVDTPAATVLTAVYTR